MWWQKEWKPKNSTNFCPKITAMKFKGITFQKFLTEQQKKQTPAFHLSVDATNTKTILTIQALPQKSSGEITLQKFSDSEYAKKTTLTSSQSNQYALISAPRCKDAT